MCSKGQWDPSGAARRTMVLQPDDLCCYSYLHLLLSAADAADAADGVLKLLQELPSSLHVCLSHRDQTCEFQSWCSCFLLGGVVITWVGCVVYDPVPALLMMLILDYCWTGSPSGWGWGVKMFITNQTSKSCKLKFNFGLRSFSFLHVFCNAVENERNPQRGEVLFSADPRITCSSGLLGPSWKPQHLLLVVHSNHSTSQLDSFSCDVGFWTLKRFRGSFYCMFSWMRSEFVQIWCHF